MAQQTAVNFIEENLNEFNWEQVFDKAKQMEKEQIIKTHLDCWGTNQMSAEQYYNETFTSTPHNGNPSAT